MIHGNLVLMCGGQLPLRFVSKSYNLWWGALLSGLNVTIHRAPVVVPDLCRHVIQREEKSLTYFLSLLTSLCKTSSIGYLLSGTYSMGILSVKQSFISFATLGVNWNEIFRNYAWLDAESLKADNTGYKERITEKLPWISGIRYFP